MQDSDGYNTSTSIGAIAGDTPVERPITIGSPIGIAHGVVRRYKGVDRIEHIAPVAGVGHILELDVAVLPGGCQELVGAHAVGASQVKRFPDCRWLCYTLQHHIRPKPRVADQVTRQSSDRS